MPRQEITSTDRLPRWRAACVWALVVLTAVLSFMAALTIWVNEQALDTENWTETSGRLLEDEQIRSTLAAYLVDQLYENVDVAAQLRELLPDDQKGLAGAAAAGLRFVGDRAAGEVLESSAVQGLWRVTNRTAHQEFLRVIDGRADEVVLDQRPLVNELAGRLGLDEQEVEAALGPNAGRLVILQADEISVARTGIKVIRSLNVLLLLVCFVLWAVALVLAVGKRRETLRNIGLSVVVVCGALLAVRSFAGQAIVDSLVSADATRGASLHVWLIGTSLLTEIAIGGLTWGIIAVAGAWLAGPHRAAVGIRRKLAPTLARKPIYVYAGTIAAYLGLILVLPNRGGRQLIFELLVIALLVVGVEALRRQVRREFPPVAQGST